MLLTLCAAAAPLLQAAELTGSLDGPLPSGDVLVEAIDTSLRVVGEVLVADDGDFHLEGLPALPVRLRVSPVDEQGLPDRYYPDGDGWCEGALVSLARGQVANGHRISLVTGAQLTGRLLGPDGTPAAGAAVIATPVDDGPITWQRSVLADDDGIFALTGLPTSASGLRLALTHDTLPDTRVGGYDVIDAEVFQLQDGEVRDLGDVAFGEGVSLAGVVQDEAGLPVAGAAVRVRIGAVTERVDTDADGRWALGGLRAGDAEVWVAQDGWAVHYWPGADRPSERIHLSEDGDDATDVNLVLTPETTLSGQITDGPEGLEEVGLKAVNDDGSVSIKVDVDADGAFTARRLAAGDWTLWIDGDALGGVADSARDRDGQVLSWRLAAGQAADAGALPWVAEGVLSGRVRDADGLPVLGATVTALPDDAGLPQLTAATDDHGRYSLEGMVAGAYRVRVSVDAPCDGDPGYVDTWWPDARLQSQAQALRPVAGAVLDDVDWVIPTDRDHDGMDDRWETARGLDPTVDDGGLDPDGDGYSNLEEYQLGTDPVSSGGRGAAVGGCGGSLSLAGLWLLPLGWRRRLRD